MTYLLFAYLLALVLPLFLRSWQRALWGLRVQGVALAGMVWLHMAELQAAPLLLLADCLLLRALLAPGLLQRVARRRQVDTGFDLIPANLLVWTLAGSLLMTAFGFAATLAGDQAFALVQLGAAVSGVLVALFILASQRTPFGQAVAILTLENGIALFELHGHHRLEWPLQAALSLVLLLTVLTLYRLVGRLGLLDTTPPQPKDTAIL